MIINIQASQYANVVTLMWFKTHKKLLLQQLQSRKGKFYPFRYSD